jgi:hypothetical protein
MKCCCTTAHRTAWQRPPNAAAIGGNTIAYHAQVSAYGGVVFCHRGHLLQCITASVSASCTVVNPRKTAHNIHRCNKGRRAELHRGAPHNASHLMLSSLCHMHSFSASACVS